MGSSQRGCYGMIGVRTTIEADGNDGWDVTGLHFEETSQKRGACGDAREKLTSWTPKHK